MHTVHPIPPSARAAAVSRLRAAGCVFAEDEAALLIAAARSPEELDALVDRRSTGVPLELVLGWAEFCGLRIAVAPGVFVPRRRSEYLAEQAAALCPPHALVVDLCCGSGALGAALAARVPGVTLHAADLDPAAVACARRNLAPYRGEVHHGDLFAALPRELRGRIDVLVANVPYVPSADVPLLPPEAREHEPLLALDGGTDGLAVLRRVTAEACAWLAPDGHLLTEASPRQAEAARTAFTAGGLDTTLHTDEDRYTTVVAGSPTPSASGPKT